jgi:hypothetical protein
MTEADIVALPLITAAHRATSATAVGPAAASAADGGGAAGSYCSIELKSALLYPVIAGNDCFTTKKRVAKL